MQAWRYSSAEPCGVASQAWGRGHGGAGMGAQAQGCGHGACKLDSGATPTPPGQQPGLPMLLLPFPDAWSPSPTLPPACYPYSGAAPTLTPAHDQVLELQPHPTRLMERAWTWRALAPMHRTRWGGAVRAHQTPHHGVRVRGCVLTGHLIMAHWHSSTMSPCCCDILLQYDMVAWQCVTVWLSLGLVTLGSAMPRYG